MKKRGKEVDQDFKDWKNKMQQVKINTHVDEYLASAAKGLDILTENKVAAFIYDYAAGNYSYMNEYFTRLMGRSREQILEEGIAMMQKIVHPEDFSKCLNLTRKAIVEFTKMKEKESESIYFRFFFRLKRSTGGYMWVMQSNRLLFSGNDARIDIAFILELFDPQHPLKVMGILETPNRRMEMYPDGEMMLLSLLSHRELEILQLIRQGISTNDIAVKLIITMNTVKAHRRNLLKKLDVHTMVQAIGMLDKLG